jgi:uncharacterized iron-regulated membrane protein
VKSKQFRDVVFIAHRYIGLVVGILADAIGLTGSLLIIHGWTSTLFSQSSQSVSVPANGQPLMLPELILKAKALQPNLTLESLDLLIPILHNPATDKACRMDALPVKEAITF